MIKENNILEKECEVCGKFFETTNKLRLYCDDCQKNTARKKRQYASNLTKSKWKDPKEPYVTEHTCAYCGNEFKIKPRLLVSYDNLDFCNKTHMKAYIKKNIGCKICGKSLENNDFYTPDKYEVPLCSPECENEYKINKAKENGTLKVCQNCGKTFIMNPYTKGIFCNITCSREAMRNGWVIKHTSPEKRQRKNTMIIPPVVRKHSKCVICGTERIIEIETSKLNLPWVCSKECKRTLISLIEKEKAKKKIQEEKQIKTKKQKEQICATCKIHYNKCERILSGYKNVPKGAETNKNGLVINCPNYC